jgi:hypothetical protein
MRLLIQWLGWAAVTWLFDDNNDRSRLFGEREYMNATKSCRLGAAREEMAGKKKIHVLLVGHTEKRKKNVSPPLSNFLPYLREDHEENDSEAAAVQDHAHVHLLLRHMTVQSAGWCSSGLAGARGAGRRHNRCAVLSTW